MLTIEWSVFLAVSVGWITLDLLSYYRGPNKYKEERLTSAVTVFGFSSLLAILVLVRSWFNAYYP